MPEGTVSQVAVTPGSGSNVATFSISEGGGTKQIQRIALSDSNGNDLAGSTTDAAAANTDTTPISWMAVFKQISLSVQAIATSVAGTLATTATQAGNWVMRLNDGSGNSISSTGGSLNVNVTNGSSGGTALADEAAFTEGTTNATPIGGVYKSSQTALTSGQFGAVALSALRELMGLFKIWDGTNTAAVKAGGTAPVQSDPALVVALSPNSVNANGPTTASASAPVTLPTDAAPTTISQTPTVKLTAYTAGNEVGGIMTFSGAGRTPGTSGIVQDVTITCKTAQTGELDLYLFNANPSNSTWTDGAVPAINAADVSKVIGVCKLTKTYSGLGTHTLYKPDETTWAPLPFAGSTLYGVLVTPGVPSALYGTTSDLVVTIQVI